MATVVLKCPLCGALSLNLRAYISHLRLVHSSDSSFNIMCGISDCREVFRAFAAFSSHVYRHHRSALGLDRSSDESGIQVETVDATVESECSISREATTTSDGAQLADNEAAAVLDTVSTDVEGSIHDFASRADSMTNLHLRTAAKLLLQLKEGRQVSQAAVSDMIDGCKTLCKQTIDEFKEGVRLSLASAGIDIESVPGMSNVLSRDPNPFQGIDTTYLYEKFCIEHLGCLEAKEIPFGDIYYINQFSGQKRRKVSTTDKFYYVPLLATLKRLMELEDFRNEVLNPHSTDAESVLGDFCDGTLFRSHPLFKSNPNAFQIIGYFDELEIVNPIGSYVKKHKLGCIFFFLGNIRPQYRSTFKAIHLVAVGKSQDIDKYGIDSFLAPFIEDLKTLYCDGITTSINGKELTIHGTLLAFLADTLAAHAVGGFKGSMSFALRVCRSCMITSAQMQQCLVETDCQLRTPEMHFEQCSLLHGSLYDHYSTNFGINRLSKLEEIPGFSVINGLPHDIMHDLFEGVIPLELKLLICHCVNKKYFTIDFLNERINAYDFGCNKPMPIDERLAKVPSARIRQSASQMMALTQEFTLLIGDKVPDNDQHWYSFLVLLKICNIALSPVCTQDTVAYLRVLIEEKLYLFKLLYPTEKLIPKHHYMVHYPSQILRLGPLINTWNMRQEAKLSFVKRVCRQSNYKNVCKTVATKHQFWLCYQVQTTSGLLAPNFEQGKNLSSNMLANEEDYVQIELLRLCPRLTPESIVSHPSFIVLQSSRLRIGVYVMTQYDDIRPVFGKIIDIVCVENTVVLCVQEYYGHIFNCHYNCFSITHHGVLKAVHLDTLQDYRPLQPRRSFAITDKSLYMMLPYTY